MNLKNSNHHKIWHSIANRTDKILRKQSRICRHGLPDETTSTMVCFQSYFVHNIGSSTCLKYAVLTQRKQPYHYLFCQNDIQHKTVFYLVSLCISQNALQSNQLLKQAYIQLGILRVATDNHTMLTCCVNNKCNHNTCV